MTKGMRNQCIIFMLFCLISPTSFARADSVTPGFVEQNPRITSSNKAQPNEKTFEDEFLSKAKSVVPPNGFVPDAQTAINIAEAVLIPIYGEKTIIAERPFRARLKDDIWIVVGQGPSGNVLGGEAYVKISKQSGSILLVAHSQ